MALIGQHLNTSGAFGIIRRTPGGDLRPMSCWARILGPSKKQVALEGDRCHSGCTCHRCFAGRRRAAVPESHLLSFARRDVRAGRRYRGRRPPEWRITARTT